MSNNIICQLIKSAIRNKYLFKFADVSITACGIFRANYCTLDFIVLDVDNERRYIKIDMKIYQSKVTSKTIQSCV